MKRLALGLLVLSLATATAAASEEERTPRPIGGLTFADEFELTIVNVIAHVTDKQGNPVTNLTEADFKVFQDGQQKQITNFQAYTEEVYERYSAASQPGLPPEEPAPETTPEPRAVNMVIYIDNENLHPLDRNRVLRSVREFVTANLRPPVQMMVVSFQKSLKIMQPFTSDPRPILDALREVRTHTGGRPERDSARRDVLDLMKQQIEEEGQVTGGRAARGTRSYNDIAGRIMAYADEEYHNLAYSIDGLREVVTYLAGLPGRKSVLYISNGLAMVPGIDLFTAFANTFHDHTILTEIHRYDRSATFKSLVATANSQDVSFYTVGAGGLEVVGMSSAEYRSAQDPMAASLGANSYLDSLRFMADGTGGLAIVKTNNFDGGLARIQKDLYTYYSLGYRLIPSGNDKIHRVEVTLPGHPELVMRYRRRFVEKSLETRVQDRVLAGLLHDLEENPMDIDFETGTAAPATSDRWTVPMHVSFPIDRVALLPEGEDYVGRVVLFVAARGSDGKRSDTVRQEHEIRIPANDYERALESRFGIDASLLMEAGSYRVAIGLMDQVTRQASYRTVRTTISSR